MSLSKKIKRSMLSIRQMNIRQMNIRQINIRQANARQTNVRQMNVRQINTRQINRGITRCTCQKAVLTAEAAAVLPFFVCFMVFILYFFRILQVHAGVAQALQYAGRRTAAEYNIDAGQKSDNGKEINFTALEADSETDTNLSSAYEKTENADSAAQQDDAENDFTAGLSGLVRAKLYFVKQLKKQNCPLQYVNRGITGISLMQSDFSGNYVELKAVYRMKLPVSLLGKIQFQIVQEAKCRKWTGYQIGENSKESDEWLYYTEHGTVYHTRRSCTHLDLSIRGVSYTQAASARNKSGGRYHKCEKCQKGASGHGMVYITDYGDRYHSSLSCSGLKRTIYMIRKSEASDKRLCSKCGG